MDTTHDSTLSYWLRSGTLPAFPPVAEDVRTDVLVIGGGVTGLTSAYLLAKAGKRVVVLERDRLAAADTGHTTAHLTMVTDARLSALVKSIGRDHAQAVWDAGLAAIAQIDSIVREHGIDASFEWVDGYLHAPLDATDRGAADADDTERLREDATLARELGFDAQFVDAVPLSGRPGVRFEGQARVHPRKYLAGVAAAFVALGGRIYEHSTADEFAEAPRHVTVNGRRMSFDDVVIATHNPMSGFSGTAGSMFFQTKLALYTSYVVAGRVPRGTVPDALWWDTAEPYHYLRVEPHDHRDLVILGGEDHKTGQQHDTHACYRRLEARLAALIPNVDLSHRWSGQVIETPDGLPYIGRSAEHQYSATGFAGNGMTFGTLAGVMITDAILERANPWAELFDPGRRILARSVWRYLTENADYPYYMVRDRFAGAESRTARAIRRGHGKVLDRNGAKVAAYRDEAGLVTLRSAACSHMGCLVTWNPAERTWDCPCHGSRFTPDGQVISGPAQAPLSPV